MCGKDDPLLLGMDDISFIHPVEIGCVVEYRSSVQYCTNDFEVGVDHLLDAPIRDGFPVIAVRVQADVLNLESGALDPSHGQPLVAVRLFCHTHRGADPVLLYSPAFSGSRVLSPSLFGESIARSTSLFLHL